MKDYQYILLDWDGNLAKTLDIWLIATRTPFVTRGLKVTDAQVTSCFGMPIERYTELGIKDVDTAITEMDEVAAKLLPNVELYPDALYVLEQLKSRGKKIALITTSLKSNVTPVLDKYNIHHFFDVVVTHEDTSKHKPDPEPLSKALELLEGNPAVAIMIGDSDKDIMAANNAGIDSVLFFPEEHATFYSLDEFRTLKPTYIIDDFRKVLDFTN